MYRIFIVEDDPGIAEGIKRQAEAWGLEVRCADDLRNVMGEFAAFSPHLVLLDITLPFSTAITGAARSARCRRCR